MALQSSGPISLNNVAGEFGGSTPHSLSEYYGVDDGVPGSGTISLSNFYGKSVTAPEPEPEPEPNLPFRQTGFGGQIYRANYESTPGFPAATNRDKYYCLQDSGNPGGPVNGGVFTDFPDEFQVSDGNSIEDTINATDYVLVGSNENITDETLTYDSTAGGLQDWE